MRERPTTPEEVSPDRYTELVAKCMAEAAERTREAAAPTTVAAQRTGLVSLAAGVGVKKTLGGVLPDWVVVLTGSVLVGSPPSASSRRSGASYFRARRRPSPTYAACRGYCCSR